MTLGQVVYYDLTSSLCGGNLHRKSPISLLATLDVDISQGLVKSTHPLMTIVFR